MSSNYPTITVIIPVRNEAQYIYRTLSQIYDQAYPRDRMEVIVADGMSADGTPDVVQRFAERHSDLNIKLLRNASRLSSAGRNLAIKHGKGDYFLLIDGHVHLPSKELLAKAVAFAEEHGARVLGRPQPLTPPDLSDFQTAVALARQSPLAHSQESYIYSDFEGWVSPLSVAVMYERGIFREFGLFDETFDAAEDLEFNYRLERGSLRCFTSPLMKVCYYPRECFRSLFRQLFRYGQGRAAFILKHRQRFTLESVIPALFFVALIGLFLFGFFEYSAWSLLAIVLSVYSTILGAESYRINRRCGGGHLLRIPRIITVIHAGVAFGFLQGIINHMLERQPEQNVAHDGINTT